MKKVGLFAVSATIILTGMTCQAAETNETEVESSGVTVSEDVQISMEEIVDANLVEHIFQNYSSISAEQRNFLDPQNYSSVYLTPDILYYEDEDNKCSIADGKYRVSGLNEDDEDTIENFYYLDGTEPVVVDMYPHIIEFSSTSGEVVSCRQDGDRLYVQLSMDQEYAEEAYELEDGDRIEWEMVLDATTHAVYSLEENLIQKDDCKWLLFYTVYEYDQEILPAFNEFQAELAQADQEADGTRTVTAIIDPGTEEETVQSYEVSKGQSVYLFYDTSIYGEYRDEDGTISSVDVEPDYESDVTIYYIKK